MAQAESVKKGDILLRKTLATIFLGIIPEIGDPPFGRFVHVSGRLRMTLPGFVGHRLSHSTRAG